MMMRDKKYDDATGNAYCCAKERERERRFTIVATTRERRTERREEQRLRVILALHISKLIFPNAHRLSYIHVVFYITWVFPRV